MTPFDHVKSLLSKIDGLYAEVFYSRAHSPDRIHRIHKGSVFGIEFATDNSGEMALLLFPDGYRVDHAILKATTGRHWQLLADGPQGADVSPPSVFVDTI